MRKYKLFIVFVVLIAIGSLVFYRIFLRNRNSHSEPSHIDSKVAVNRIADKSLTSRDTEDKPSTVNNSSSTANVQHSAPNNISAVIELIERLRRLINDRMHWAPDSESVYRDYLNQLKIFGIDALPYLRDVILNLNEAMELRTDLIQVVGSMKGEEPATFLLGLFSSKSTESNIRYFAIESVRKSGDSRIFDTVRIIFEGEQDYPARYHLAQIIGETRDERAIPILIRTLENPEERQVRYFSAIALKNFLGDFGVREKLKYYAVQDSDPVVRKNCILALGEYKKDEIKDFLEQVLKNETNHKVLKATRAMLEKNFGVK